MNAFAQVFEGPYYEYFQRLSLWIMWHLHRLSMCLKALLFVSSCLSLGEGWREHSLNMLIDLVFVAVFACAFASACIQHMQMPSGPIKTFLASAINACAKFVSIFCCACLLHAFGHSVVNASWNDFGGSQSRRLCRDPGWW